MNALSALQKAIIDAGNNEASLVSLVGQNAIVDAPKKRQPMPYITFSKHRMIARPSDGSVQDHEHLLQMTCWVEQASASRAADIAFALTQVVTEADISNSEIHIISADHLRTETGFDARRGRTRARVDFRFFTHILTD